MKINEIYYKNLFENLSDGLSDDEKKALEDLIDNDFYANAPIDYDIYDFEIGDWEIEVDSDEE